MTIEINWSDLTKFMQEYLIEQGYDDDNVIDNVFPLTILEIEDK
jgi:hypothetical protein